MVLKLSPEDRIIVPLDVASEAAALAQVAALPQVQFWKVGLELFVSCGPALIAILKQQGKRVFLDLKLHDIPNTVAGAARAAAGHGVDLLTVHAAGGRAMLQAAVAGAAEGAAAAGVPPPRLVAITLLTSLSARELAFDLKIPLELPEYVLTMALIAQDCGLAGAVCSPQEAKAIRRLAAAEFCLVTPGVRPAWSAPDDQRRHTTPTEALQAGADYLVIGRPITTDPEPAQAFARLCAELAEVSP